MRRPSKPFQPKPGAGGDLQVQDLFGFCGDRPVHAGVRRQRPDPERSCFERGHLEQFAWKERNLAIVTSRLSHPLDRARYNHPAAKRSQLHVQVGARGRNAPIRVRQQLLFHEPSCAAERFQRLPKSDFARVERDSGGSPTQLFGGNLQRRSGLLVKIGERRVERGVPIDETELWACQQAFTVDAAFDGANQLDCPMGNFQIGADRRLAQSLQGGAPTDLSSRMAASRSANSGLPS